jgi:uncharacterized protein (DUF433 family)
MGLMEPVTHHTEDPPSMTGKIPLISEFLVATPETCGGKPRIAGTRVRVKDIVIWHVHMGMTPAEIVSKWPQLSLASVHAALAYYYDHREAMEAEIGADQASYDERKTSAPSLVRERLEALKATHAADDSLPPG